MPEMGKYPETEREKRAAKEQAELMKVGDKYKDMDIDEEVKRKKAERTKLRTATQLTEESSQKAAKEGRKTGKAAEIWKLNNQGLTLNEIVKRTGYSRAIVYGVIDPYAPKPLDPDEVKKAKAALKEGIDWAELYDMGFTAEEIKAAKK